jgi:hypothetical protein
MMIMVTGASGDGGALVWEVVDDVVEQGGLSCTLQVGKRMGCRKKRTREQEKR